MNGQNFLHIAADMIKEYEEFIHLRIEVKESRFYQIMRILIREGAEVHVKDDDGNTASDYIIRKSPSVQSLRLEGCLGRIRVHFGGLRVHGVSP